MALSKREFTGRPRVRFSPGLELHTFRLMPGINFPNTLAAPERRCLRPAPAPIECQRGPIAAADHDCETGAYRLALGATANRHCR